MIKKILLKIWSEIRLRIFLLFAFPLLFIFYSRNDVKDLVLMMKAVLLKYLLLYHPELKDSWKNSDYEISLDYATSILCNSNFVIDKDDDFVFYESTVNDIIEKLKKIVKVTRILSKYYSIRIFLHLLYNKLVHSNEIFNSKNSRNILGKIFINWTGGLQFRFNLIALNQDLIKFRDFKDYTELRKEIISEKKVIDKNFFKAYSLKIHLSSTNLSVILSFFSILFLITGYFYNYFLLRSYNIQVSSFYNLSDYLATSVEKIKYSLVGSVIALIGSFSRYKRYYCQLPWEKDYSITSSLKSLKWLLLITSFMIGLGLIFRFNNSYYLNISFIAIFLSINNLSMIFSEKFFKDTVSSYFIIAFLLSYSLYFAYDSLNDYNKKTKNNYSFEFKDNIIDLKDLKWINSNSNYFFFYDTVKFESVIIDKRNINLIKINKNLN
jgi:hypothetical protein